MAGFEYISQAEATEVVKGPKPPKDFSYHFSRVTAARKESSVKGFYKYFLIPGIVQLAGGRFFYSSCCALDFSSYSNAPTCGIPQNNDAKNHSQVFQMQDSSHMTRSKLKSHGQNVSSLLLIIQMTQAKLDLPKDSPPPLSKRVKTPQHLHT